MIDFRIGERLSWNGRTGVVLAAQPRPDGGGYVRLLMDDVPLAYWVDAKHLDEE